MTASPASSHGAVRQRPQQHLARNSLRRISRRNSTRVLHLSKIQLVSNSMKAGHTILDFNSTLVGIEPTLLLSQCAPYTKGLKPCGHCNCSSTIPSRLTLAFARSCANTDQSVHEPPVERNWNSEGTAFVSV